MRRSGPRTYGAGAAGGGLVTSGADTAGASAPPSGEAGAGTDAGTATYDAGACSTAGVARLAQPRSPSATHHLERALPYLTPPTLEATGRRFHRVIYGVSSTRFAS